MGGIEDAIEICREIKDTEVDTPPSLQDRILAATVGPRNTSWPVRAKESIIGFWAKAARTMMTPEMAAAMLIFAASSLLVLSRFGSLGEMASHTGKQAGQFVNQGQRAFNTVQFGLLGEEPTQPSKPINPATNTPVTNTKDTSTQPAQVSTSPSPEQTPAKSENESPAENLQRQQHRKK